MASECDPSVVDGNVGLAFGLVTAAGLSTTVGAATAFIMPYSTSSKNLFLAASLSIAAGVMLYVSFIEIFASKAIADFTACVDERFAYLYATLCFFGGVLITYLFDIALHHIDHLLGKRKARKAAPDPVFLNSTEPTPSNLAPSPPSNHLPSNRSFQDVEDQNSTSSPSSNNVNPQPIPNTALDNPLHVDEEYGHDGHMIASIYENHSQDTRALIRMGIFAGLALAFHNFPEGLATFVAVLEDPSVGASVAIAIGIHNIPEGICVAMPIYYATGSKGKAFFWATLSGMTELVGALLGWLVLRKVFTKLVYGVLFGVVAGMMVYISLKELLPSAHRYDPEDKVTTIGLVIGMAIMALSLVLFQF
eukprot:GFKZ01007757.1.p1 GENE.GFKZ01007757.1~~GFKZ01007757.1.p1  ORF type:complete len:396 (+),score=50.00 GFKZ01007757.1:100-1188(+)